MQAPRALLVSVIVLIALAGALISLEYGRLTRGFYSQVVSAEGRGIRDRLGIFLTPPLSAQNLTGKLLAQSGQARSSGDLEMIILSALGDEQSLSAVSMGDDRGLSAMGVREDGGFLLYIRPGADGSGGKWERLDSELHRLGNPDVPKENLEPFARMVGEIMAKRSTPGPAWTDTHPLPGRKAASITSIVPTTPDPSAKGGYLAFSFGLDTVWNVLSKDQPEGARILLLSEDGFILVPDRADAPLPQNMVQAPLFVPKDKITDQVRLQAMKTWLEGGKTAMDSFSFTAEGKTWWSSLLPLSDEGGGHTFVGLAISQDDLLGLLFQGHTTLILIGSGLGLAVLILLAVIILSRRRQRSEQGAFYESEREIRKLLDAGESERLEFKSTLRFNLAAGKPGKEIELAVLKTLTAFMNTGGGVLAVGVDDQGRAVGLDADGFENDDHALRHFSSLFAQHIGVEFLSCVTFAVRPLEGRKVLLAECRKSKTPVILKGGKEEEFYVRAGPSSRRLSLTEFMRRVAK